VWVDRLQVSNNNIARPLASSLADSLQAYGQVHKPVSHKQYEAACRSMDRLGAWESTQNHLCASMDIGRPSTLMSPLEHIETRLSLRRQA
jgi:hypothetical protein